MVRIRMQRFGRTHRPFYRINAIEKRNRRNGRVIENLGWYDPVSKDESKQVELNAERIKHWLDHGAQPSETVEDILARHDLLSDKQKSRWEARRAKDKALVVSKTAVARAEKAVEQLKALAGETEAEVGSFVDAAGKALKAATDAVAKTAIDAAEQAAKDAEAALAEAKKADEKAKADKAAAEAKAAEEAKATEASEDKAEEDTGE